MAQSSQYNPCDPYWITAFGEDTEGFNIDTSGLPGIATIAAALQVWAMAQSGSASVAQAAQTFRVPVALVKEAIDWHPWMYASGPDDDYTKLIIEHEGE